MVKGLFTVGANGTGAFYPGAFYFGAFSLGAYYLLSSKRGLLEVTISIDLVSLGQLKKSLPGDIFDPYCLRFKRPSKFVT